MEKSSDNKENTNTSTNDNLSIETGINKKDIELLSEKVAKYKDFPKPGILFYDIFSILYYPDLSKILYDNSIIKINNYLKLNKKSINFVVGLESRGFLLGAVIAEKLNIGFIPIRKKANKNTKLPGKILTEEYITEYSNDAFDLQAISINSDSKVLLVDDLVATGGSLRATENLIQLGGGSVEAVFCVFEIVGLKGRNVLKDSNSLISLIDI